MNKPIGWAELYATGRHVSRWPHDAVIAFVKRHVPMGAYVLDLGCGMGNHLWLLEEEGYRFEGIDQVRATDWPRAHVGDVRALPWKNATFDAAIDRMTLTYLGHEEFARAVQEVRRVLKPGGHFFCNCYGQDSELEPSPAIPVTRFSHANMKGAFAGWDVIELRRIDSMELVKEKRHQEWIVIARKG